MAGVSERGSPVPGCPRQRRALQAGAPFAAITWESLAPGNIIDGFKTFKDRVYYGDVLPPVGSQTISYARFLDLMSRRKARPHRAACGRGPRAARGAMLNGLI